MKKKFIGQVISKKTDKTAVVEVSLFKTHPIYKKRYRRTKKIMAHDPQNSFREGQIVEIVETRPISARKSWLITREIVK